MLDEDSDGITRQQRLVLLAYVENLYETLLIIREEIASLADSIEVWDENDSEM